MPKPFMLDPISLNPFWNICRTWMRMHADAVVCCATHVATHLKISWPSLRWSWLPPLPVGAGGPSLSLTSEEPGCSSSAMAAAPAHVCRPHARPCQLACHAMHPVCTGCVTSTWNTYTYSALFVWSQLHTTLKQCRQSGPVLDAYTLSHQHTPLTQTYLCTFPQKQLHAYVCIYKNASCRQDTCSLLSTSWASASWHPALLLLLLLPVCGVFICVRV